MVAPHQPIEIREFERPELPPGSALLRTAHSEVCGLIDAENMILTKALVDPWGQSNETIKRDTQR
jgi:hypothetical protein